MSLFEELSVQNIITMGWF